MHACMQVGGQETILNCACMIVYSISKHAVNLITCPGCNILYNNNNYHTINVRGVLRYWYLATPCNKI